MGKTLSASMCPAECGYIFQVKHICELHLPGGFLRIAHIDLIPKHQLQTMDANLANSSPNDEAMPQGEAQ